MTPGVDPFLLAAERAVGDDLDTDPSDVAAAARRAAGRRSARAGLPWKACRACGHTLPARAYADAPHRPDGLRSVCRGCSRLGQLRRGPLAT